MELPPTGHEPVLLNEVLQQLDPRPGQTIVDATLGRAGHALRIAEQLGTTGTLIGLDMDERNLQFASERLKNSPCRVRLFHANFAQLDECLRQAECSKVHGIVADLGISTNQLFDAEYGMSFEREMPLDMRLDRQIGKSAADLVNELSADELADVLYLLAQERHSRRIARKIVEARRFSPIKTTEALAQIVRSAMPVRRGPPERIDAATRTFLALRMAVNREVENLARLLETGPSALEPGGTMAVISFQSMEDRAVKQAFRSLEQAGAMTILTKKPLTPAPDEIAANPRSRSAKLRAIRRK